MGTSRGNDITSVVSIAKAKCPSVLTHLTPQIMTHRRCLSFLPHFPFMLSFNANEKTSCTPCPVFAEHSVYRAPISLATADPWSEFTGVWPCAPSIRLVCSSARRSILVPTRIRGVPSQKWATSGNHYKVLFSDALNMIYHCTTHLVLNVS